MCVIHLLFSTIRFVFICIVWSALICGCTRTSLAISGRANVCVFVCLCRLFERLSLCIGDFGEGDSILFFSLRHTGLLLTKSVKQWKQRVLWCYHRIRACVCMITHTHTYKQTDTRTHLFGNVQSAIVVDCYHGSRWGITKAGITTANREEKTGLR